MFKIGHIFGKIEYNNNIRDKSKIAKNGNNKSEDIGKKTEIKNTADSDIDMEEWVRKNVIAPLKDGIDSDDLGGMTANLLGGKTEDESIGDYEKRISTAISDIKAYCKKNKIEIPFNQLDVTIKNK